MCVSRGDQQVELEHLFNGSALNAVDAKGRLSVPAFIRGVIERRTYDTSGRIILPPMMRRKGRIEELALFVGVGGTFEIWNPHLALESGDDDLRDLAAYRLEEKGIAL